MSRGYNSSGPHIRFHFRQPRAWSDEFGGMISWTDAAMHEQFRLVSGGVMV